MLLNNWGKMRLRIVIGSLFLILANTLFARNTFKESDYEKLIDRLGYHYIKDLKAQEEEFYLIGSGGKMMNDIQEVFFHFIQLKEVTVDQARALFVRITEDYLQRVNNDQSVRPYLHNYPFTRQNLDFQLGFWKKGSVHQDSSVHQDNGITYIFNSKDDRLCYFAYDGSNLQLVYQEPYEEALEIVKASGQLEAPEKIPPKKLTFKEKVIQKKQERAERRLLGQF